MRHPLRIVAIVGARPNFVKIAPIIAHLRRRPDRFQTTLVHTGQHYDERMSKVFFDDLGIPRPDVNLDVGSDTHARQTAAILAAIEPVLVETRAELLLVVGDVNSTIACALAAAKRGIRVAHVEAGLRSFDRSMPEEINRLVTDQLSDLLFTSEPSGEHNLRREGVDPSKIHFVGNVMIDTLLTHRARAHALRVHEQFGLERRGFVLLTLHRPSNVDDPATFARIVQAIAAISEDSPVLFPVHPRTRPTIAASPAAAALVDDGRLRLTDPLGYLEFLGLMESSRAILTDSGGVQEESTILGVPCLTLRDNTERPVTVTHGTNRIVGTDPEKILCTWRQVGDASAPQPIAPPLWDGQAALRIVDVLHAA